MLFGFTGGAGEHAKSRSHQDRVKGFYVWKGEWKSFMGEQFQKQLDQPTEIVSFELRKAADQIGEITGHIYTEEILDEIFSSFCIGK